MELPVEIVKSILAKLLLFWQNIRLHHPSEVVKLLTAIRLQDDATMDDERPTRLPSP